MRFLPLLLLVACEPEKPPGGADDTGPLPPLGNPFMGVIAAAAPGTFRVNECRIRVELYEEGTVILESQMIPDGGEWTGGVVPGSATYTAATIWETCTTGPEGNGNFTSSPFSGVEGDMFMFHYNGVAAAFDVLHQREDFEGGVATIIFEDATTLAEVNAMADEHGVTAELVEGTTYTMRWEDGTSVGEVITAFSGEREYSTASPVWLRTPDWW